MAYSEDLRQLRAQMERKRQLEVQVRELQTQREHLTRRVQELQRQSRPMWTGWRGTVWRLFSMASLARWMKS